MKKIFIASCVAVLAMTAASAETRSSTEYFIVLDTKTKTCTIVDKKPKTKTLKIVGDVTQRTGLKQKPRTERKSSKSALRTNHALIASDLQDDRRPITRTKNRRPCCWNADKNDQGTVTETNWAGVTIKWDNRSEQAILHNDMAQVEQVPGK
jgi:hypothetical protein